MSKLAYLLIAILTWTCGYFLQKNNDFEGKGKIRLTGWLNLFFGLPRSKKHLDIWGTTAQLMSYFLTIGVVIVTLIVKDVEASQIILFYLFVAILATSTILGILAVRYFK